MMIRKLYPRLHLSEAEFKALPECGIYGPLTRPIGTRWKSRFTDGWFIGVWETAGGWSYEAQRRWYQPVVRCARVAELPRCAICREAVADDALDVHAWELNHSVKHRRCPGPYVVVRVGGYQAGKLSQATTDRILAGIDARMQRYG